MHNIGAATFFSSPQTVDDRAMSTKQGAATKRLVELVISLADDRRTSPPTVQVNLQEVNDLILDGANLHKKITYNYADHYLFDVLSGSYDMGFLCEHVPDHPIASLVEKMIIADPSVIYDVRKQRMPFIRWQCLNMINGVEAAKVLLGEGMLKCLPRGVSEESLERSLGAYDHPLTSAIYRKNGGLVKFFIENGYFTVHDKSGCGRSPIDIAEKSLEWQEMTDYLKSKS